MSIRLTTIFILFILCLQASAISTEVLLSPDKNIKIEFAEDSLRNNQNAPAYQVLYKGKLFLLPSSMGVQIAGQPTFVSFLKIINVKRREQRGSWKPVYGERSGYPDNYNEMSVTMQEKILPNRIITVVFRAYNEGIAFRYEFPVQPKLKSFSIVRELTEFTFADSTKVWEEYGHEGLYSRVLAREIKPNCELPLTVETTDGIFAAIAEGGSSDYPRAYIQSASNPRSNNNAISISLRGEAKGNAGYVSTWRMITLGDRAGDLMERNYLLLNLNKPNVINDPSWIKPGKAIRDVTLSTEGSKRYIDYAQKQGINYVILDWGWYGPPNGEDSDPSYVNVVNVGTCKPIPNHTGLSIPEIVAYGKSKGVGIFLYVNRQGLERYMDKIFPIYQSWGIKGIKPGFINVGNQEWIQWVDTLVSKAAKYYLMVDIHDAYRPTGLSRTYPNLLSQEGIRGNEHTPDADHNTKLPFTRYTIGAGDYTPGYCRTSLQNTWTHRLALPIIFYSPGQFLFWGEALSECHNRPELSLWHDVPTTWDDTKVLDGAVGGFAIVARRKGKDWFVGGITNHEARTLEVDLSFLAAGKKYEATLYQDDASKQQVLMEKRKVGSKTVIAFPLMESGGFAMQIKMQ